MGVGEVGEVGVVEDGAEFFAEPEVEIPIGEGGTGDDERLAFAFRRCLSRVPSEKERAVLLGFLAAQKERLAAAPDRIKELTGSKDDATPERGAWTALARVLLNLDETITKE